MTMVTLLLTWAGLHSGPYLCPPIECEGPWQWPLRPRPEVVRAFAPPEDPWAPGHRGVDLAAHPGQPVYAAGSGRISYAGPLAGRGVIAISHGALRTTYLPVRPSVRPGQPVRAGDRIGTVQSLPGHCGPRPCLHWGARQGLVYADPLSLLGRGQIRLLPIWNIPAQVPYSLRAAAPAPPPWPGARAAAQDPPAVTAGSPASAELHGAAHGTSPAAAATAVSGAAITVLAMLLALRRRGRTSKITVRPGGGPGDRSA
jgi:hypothetical protein